MLQEGIAELERAAGFWDPKVLRRPWWSLYWEDLAQAYRQAGRYDDAIAAYEMAQFFRFSVHPHLQVQLAIGETYRIQEDYAREMDAYMRAVEVLSVRDKLAPEDRDLLRSLARHAVTSYQRQKLTAEEALMAHELLIKTDGRVTKAYLALFQAEVERRLP
jgi:tetratricopeptide (TPR) repeat protein